MKYDNFITLMSLPFTQREIDHFVTSNKELLKKYDASLELTRVNVDKYFLMLTFKREQIQFRNIFKSRIEYRGISFRIYKKSGYLPNMANNDPKYQYICDMIVSGSEIKYRKSYYDANSLDDNTLFGTEFTDLDFSQIIENLFNTTLKVLK